MQVLVVGDVCPQLRHERLMVEGRYSELYGDFQQALSGNDLNIANLECPLTAGGRAIAKTGRHLKASPLCVGALVSGHFNLLALANNHIMDYGAEAMLATREACAAHGIDCVGAAATLAQAEEPFFYMKNGLKLAVLNFAEQEFSIASPARPGANPLNPVRNFSQVRRAAQEADCVLVIVHGGQEHYPYPTPRMIDTYRFFVDVGADVVVGHHSHCYSGFEQYGNGRIFYGIGNFLFDHPTRRDGRWTHGYAVRLTLGAAKNVSFSLLPYVQGAELPGVVPLPQSDFPAFKSSVEALNAVIQSPEATTRQWDDFVERRSIWMLQYLLPFNELLNTWYLRLGLPLPFSEARLLRLLNMVRCESHREALVSILERRSG